MKAAIEKIKIVERIRKEITRIPELAADIEKNGLINPVTVMPLDGGEFQLLAGLRRVKAAQSLGLPEIEVFIVTPADAESALCLEISENEQREPFTYSEKMDYARLIEEIERAKAKERMSVGGKGGLNEGMDDGPYLHSGQRRDAIGAKINMSGRQYDRAKYLADNAPAEIIDQLDSGERTISGAYDELRAKEKTGAPSKPATESEQDRQSGSPPPQKPTRSDGVAVETQMKNLSEKDREGVRKLREFSALPPEGKIEELQRQLKEQRARAADAESDLAMLRERYGIDVDHKDSIIESLKRQNAELHDALAAANARIAELEASTHKQ